MCSESYYLLLRVGCSSPHFGVWSCCHLQTCANLLLSVKHVWAKPLQSMLCACWLLFQPSFCCLCQEGLYHHFFVSQAHFYDIGPLPKWFSLRQCSCLTSKLLCILQSPTPVASLLWNLLAVHGACFALYPCAVAPATWSLSLTCFFFFYLIPPLSLLDYGHLINTM